MTDTINIGVLVAARDEYSEVLKSNLAPLIIQGFNSIYNDALKITGGKHTLKQFQILLREIIGWNQSILSNECSRIKKKYPLMMDCLTAILVSSVKILSSVRLNTQDKDIQIKICTPDIFIHAIYIECGKQFFYNPWLFYHNTTKLGTLQKRKFDILQIVKESIDECVRKLLPLESIVQEYLREAIEQKNTPQEKLNDDEIHEDDIDDEYDSEENDVDDEEDEQQQVNVDPVKGHERIKNVTVPTDGKNSRMFSLGDNPINNTPGYTDEKPMFINNENDDNDDEEEDEDDIESNGPDDDDLNENQEIQNTQLPPPQTLSAPQQQPLIHPQEYNNNNFQPAHTQPPPQTIPMQQQLPQPPVPQLPPPTQQSQEPQTSNQSGNYSFF